jgi:hypothetical protein
LLEKSSVDWLLNVIDEEARRAEKIVGQGGALVRPYEATTPEGELGPLGMVEKSFVDFLGFVGLMNFFPFPGFD